MKDIINKTEKSSDGFRSVIENNKAKIGVFLLAAFLGAATVSHFVAPDEAEALPKPRCFSGLCI